MVKASMLGRSGWTLSAKPRRSTSCTRKGYLKGKAWKGIYALDGDKAEDLRQRAQPGEGPPTAPAAKSGSAAPLATFKRAKP